MADWEHSHGGDPRSDDEAASADQAYEASRAERYATSRERDQTAAGRAQRTADRLVAATQRDEVARIRDLNAAARDREAQARDDAAEARDRAAEARECQAVEAGSVDPSLLALRALRAAAASIRQRAAVERAAAARDREAAAADRRRAAADRQHSGLDELTGVFRRATGELALIHEIDRSRRLDRSMVLAMIDVDSLKSINDTEGHAAGDALLRDVPTAIAQTLRSYDITVRWGGDEFVCALSEVTSDVAADRFAQVQRMLEALRPGASISVGLAELTDDDTLESLVSRADAALYIAKSRRRR